MAVHKGVTNLDGHTQPAVGAINSRESDSSLGAERDRGTDGNRKFFVPHKYFRKEVTVSGVGDAELALVTPGKVTKGTLKVMRAKQMEYAGALPKFDRTGVVLADIPDA